MDAPRVKVPASVKAGEPFTLNVVTNNTQSCARDFVIPALNVNRLLPVTGVVMSLAFYAQVIRILRELRAAAKG